MLLYGKGGHFKAHKDTEKLAAMFGTLVIALPSKHEGGRLFIRHDGREIEVDFSSEAHRHEFQHAAFFADCEHEVEPVRSGYRCCVVYNLQLDDDDCDYRRRGRYDDVSTSGTMGEIYDEDLTISHWRDKRDRRVGLGTYQVDAEMLITKEKLGAGDPDEEESEGYTGNAGCTMDYLREILAPALLHKTTAKHFKLPNSLAPEILTFAKELLAAEVKRPLPPYPNWTRPCPCPRPPSPSPFYRRPSSGKPDPIAELVAFMADPGAQTHHFARPENERGVLEEFIRIHFLDLDHVTLRSSRPFTLACTKNDQSRQHALALRARDASLLEKLAKLHA